MEKGYATFSSVTKAFKKSYFLTIPKCLEHVFGRFDYIQLKLLKFGGFRFRATEDTKCHSCIFSNFMNVSLLLVFSTAQKGNPGK